MWKIYILYPNFITTALLGNKCFHTLRQCPQYNVMISAPSGQCFLNLEHCNHLPSGCSHLDSSLFRRSSWRWLVLISIHLLLINTSFKIRFVLCLWKPQDLLFRLPPGWTRKGKGADASVHDVGSLLDWDGVLSCIYSFHFYFHHIATGARPGESVKAGVGNSSVNGLPLIQRLWLRLGTLLRPGTSHFQQFLDGCISARMACKFSKVLIDGRHKPINQAFRLENNFTAFLLNVQVDVQLLQPMWPTLLLKPLSVLGWIMGKLYLVLLPKGLLSSHKFCSEQTYVTRWVSSFLDQLHSGG